MAGGGDIKQGIPWCGVEDTGSRQSSRLSAGKRQSFLRPRPQKYTHSTFSALLVSKLHSLSEKRTKTLPGRGVAWATRSQSSNMLKGENLNMLFGTICDIL